MKAGDIIYDITEDYEYKLCRVIRCNKRQGFTTTGDALETWTMQDAKFCES